MAYVIVTVIIQIVIVIDLSAVEANIEEIEYPMSILSIAVAGVIIIVMATIFCNFY